MKLKAIQSFSSGFEGVVNDGQEFTAEKERATYLIKNGYAISLEPVIEPVKPVEVVSKK